MQMMIRSSSARKASHFMVVSSQLVLKHWFSHHR